MPRVYSNHECADMHAYYGMALFNSREAARLYAAAFPNRLHPHHTIFPRIHEKLINLGSFGIERVKHGPQINQERTNVILHHFDNHPRTSVRRSSVELGFHRETIRRTLKSDHRHPFHFTPVMEMRPGDDEKRINFCNWYLRKCEETPEFSRTVLWTDEATFTRTGIFNGHNTHVWAQENPHAMVDDSFQTQFKANVWCGIIDNKIIGPHILPNRFNAEEFLLFLNNDLSELQDEVPLVLRREEWIQLDGCPAHYGRRSRTWLSENYPGRWIGRGGPIAWPPRSPDLTPLDFFLWGVLKEEVYRHAPQTLEHLLECIHEAKNTILAVQIARATASVAQRCRKCVAVRGGRFESQ